MPYPPGPEKVVNLPNLAGGQAPADVAYLIDVSAGSNRDRYSTLNDLLAEITKNITDLSVQFGDGAAATVSAANKGKLRYNDSVSAFQVSEDGGAYASLIKGSGANGRVAFYTAASVISSNSNFFWDDTNARLGIGVGSTPGLPLDVAADVSALAQQWRENGAGTARVQMQVPSSYGQLGTSSTHDFALMANGTQRLNIESGGAIAVGSISAAQGQFHIRATATGTVGLVSDNAASTSVDLAQFRLNGSNRFVFTNAAQAQIGLASSVTGSIRFFVSGSANHSTLQAGDAPASNVLYKWPADDPAAGEVLKVTSFSGGTAVLEWGAAGSGSPGTPQYSVQFNNPLGTFAGDAGFTYNPTVGTGIHWLFQGPADTGLTASTEATGLYFNLSATRTFATGAITLQREVRIAGPTYAFAGASVVATAITLDVTSPNAGANATLTNSYAARFNSSAAGHVALVANSASSPTANIFETQINGVTTTGFRVTKDGLPSSVKSSYSNGEFYGAGMTYTPTTGGNETIIGQGISVTGTGDFSYNTTIGRGITQVGTSNSYQGVFIGGNQSLGNGGNTYNLSVLIGYGSRIAFTAASGKASYQSVGVGASGTLQALQSVGVGASFNLDGTNLANVTGVGYAFTISADSSSGLGSGGNIASSAAIGLGRDVSIPSGNNNSLVAGSSSYPTNNWYGGKGITNATPTAYAINGTGGSGSNSAGATINIFAGKPTGNASPGSIGFQFARPGSSSSTLQSQSDQVVLSYSTDQISQTWQLQSSTTANQDAARLAGFWTTTTHAFRTAAFTLALVNSAAAITEFYRWTPDTFSLHEGTVPNVWTAGSYLAKIYAIDDVLNPTIQAAYFSNTGGTGGVLSLLKGRGTNASPTAIQSADRIGDLEWWGQFNTSTNNIVAGARIRANATENWSSGNNGCNMEFYTAPNASTITLRMVLTQTGTLRINPNGAYSSFTTNNLLQVGDYASWNNDAIAGIYTQSSGNKGLEIIGPSSQTGIMLRCFLDSVTPDLLTLNASGVLATRMGASSAQINQLGTSEVNTTAANNSGTGETDLMTYSLPASSLNTNGDHLEVEAWGTYANNSNNKQVKLVFGGTTLVDTGAVSIVATSWRIKATIVRTGATAQKYVAQFWDTQGLALQLNAATAAETLSGSVTIKCTGTGGASNDITQEGLIIRWSPNA